LPITPEGIEVWLRRRVAAVEHDQAVYREKVRRLHSSLRRSVNFFLPACSELTRELPGSFWRRFGG
jgi:hypothetical protein